MTASDSPAPGASAGNPTPRGMLIVDKPEGPTSMDICRRVRRALVTGGAPKRVKVGHGGTLDPLATGVVVVLIGGATKLCESLMDLVKVYEARVDLSAFSTTDDREGVRTEVAVADPPAPQAIDAALRRFEGLVMQTPPIFSAVHVDGQRAYRLARQGNAPVLAPRPVRIDAIERLAYLWPLLDLRITCGRGTYIRSLARDLGLALGTGGTLAGLRRTAVGPCTVARAIGLDALPRVLTQADLLTP